MEAYFDNESGESLVDNATVLDDIGGCSNTESSENVDRNSADSILQEKENEDIIEEDGTVSGFVSLKHGVLVGSEGRINNKRKIDGKEVAIFSRDNEVKVRKILKNVCITAAGPKNRLNRLCHHLMKKVADDKDDVLSVLSEVNRWLSINTLDEDEKSGEVPLTLYVVGYSREKKKCLTFLTGDKTDLDCLDALFGTIGGGARFAHKFMREKSKGGAIHKDMELEDAKKLMWGALLDSTFADVSCGGIFQVHWVTAESCLELPRIHAIDAAIYLNCSFKDEQIFVFNKNTYEAFNHSNLLQLLESHGFQPKMPACLGYIREPWKFFVVEMKDKKEVLRIFAIAEKIGSRKGVRQLKFPIVEDGKELTGNMVLFAANQVNLKTARRTRYLEELV